MTIFSLAYWYFLSASLVYYTTALPSIMLFVLTDRLYNAVLQVVQLVLLLALVIPVQGIYARNVVSFVSHPLRGLSYYNSMLCMRIPGYFLHLFSRLAL